MVVISLTTLYTKCNQKANATAKCAYTKNVSLTRGRLTKSFVGPNAGSTEFRVNKTVGMSTERNVLNGPGTNALA